ncbi:hypothetical protein NKH24_28860 [Mesorhizobium sp. M1300]
MSSMTKPTVMVFRRRMFWARESGWKPSDWIAARTFPNVSGLTVSGAFKLRETVPTDTPETRATSRIVAARIRVFHVAKLKIERDMMNAGDFRVSPLEVEAALAPSPSVAEIAVAEHRVRDDVSVIAAYVVRKAGVSVSAEDIVALAGQRLAAYKRPKQVFFVPSLPRSANGKLLRRNLAPD